MANTTFIVKIDEKGGINFGSEYNLARFRDFCKERKGKTLKITEQINTRTIGQNNLYWLFLGLIEYETGNNASEMHEYFKRKFLPPKFIKIKIGETEKEIKIPSSTTDLNKIDFSDYLDKISAETGVPIPDTQAYHDYYESAPLK